MPLRTWCLRRFRTKLKLDYVLKDVKLEILFGTDYVINGYMIPLYIEQQGTSSM